LLRGLFVVICFLLSTLPIEAQDATWLTNPGSNDLGVGSNWSTGTVPTGTASFGVSNTTALVTSNFNPTFGGWTFDVGASAYTVSLTPNEVYEFVGAGIALNGGSVSITNSSIFNALRFANSSTAGGATIVNSGDLSFVNSSTAGTALIQTNNDMRFQNLSTAGNSTIVNSPGGGVFFQNTSSAGNAKIANNSAAQVIPLCFCFPTEPGLGFIDYSSAGNATITTSGLTKFYDNSTGGQARFITAGFGEVDFGNPGPNGDFKVSAGSIEGAGTFGLGSGQLTVGGNNLSTQVSGKISDAVTCFGFVCTATGGSIVKVGTGTLTLSGVNTYTGTTTINGGALEVDGSIASSSATTVNSGAALIGTGTVSGTQINAGGIFAPGMAGAAGTSMSVAGNLALVSGALYVIQINPSTASFANVTGTATLGGATVNAIYANGSYVAKQYTILSAAGGISGVFSLVNTNLPNGFKATLTHGTTDAYLNISMGPAPYGNLSVNQQNVGNALTNFFNTTSGIPLVFGTLTPAGFTQASGETATGSQQTTFDAMTQFMGVMMDPFVAGRGDNLDVRDGAPTGYASTQKNGAARDAAAMFVKAPVVPFEQRWSTWAAAYGGSQTTDGNVTLGSNSATSRIYGTAVGADYRFSPFTVGGFSLAGGGTNFSIFNAGVGRSDLFQAGAFVWHSVGQAYISGALAYGWQDITTDRTVTVAGVDRLHAEFNANAFSGRIEGGYRFVAPWVGGVGITPYAAAQFTTFDLPAYAENILSGASTFALAYGARDVTDSRSELGIRTDKSFAMPDSILTLRGRFAWAHDFNSDRSIGATFQALPGASFVVNGAAQAPDSALTTASAELKWTSNWSAAASFEGEFSSVTRSYAGKGAVRYQW
jgi:autotransporter-associated beta strand protein